MHAVATTPSLSDVQDILYYIFPHLDPDQSSGEDIFRVRQTLIHSALTCRNFTRPALSALWRSLPSDKPLMSLLCTLGIAQDRMLLGREPPPELDMLNSSYGLSTLEDPRTHPNWHRFREYATHVRKIHLRPSADPLRAKWSIWTELSQLMPDEPILPLLQCVNITSKDVRSRGTAPLLLISPSVRGIHFWLRVKGISIMNDRDEPEHVLSEACARAPNLETFTLSITPIQRIHLSILPHNHHLRSISVHAWLPVEDLEPLTHLMELEYLSVILAGGGSPSTTLRFPSLRRLSVRSVWDSIRDLLERVQAPHVHSLALRVSQAEGRQLIRQANSCLHTVATRLSTLETLSVHCDRSTHGAVWALPAAWDARGALMAIVEPLLALRGLRHITLNFRLFILRLAPDDMRTLADAWPNIEELLIEVATVDGGRAGFESIIHFARRCPLLRALRLPAMDLAADAFERVEYPAEPHLLRDLDVAEVLFPCEADLSREMTTFIQRVFPNAAIPFVKPPIVVDRSRLA
ncbi:hypothetical protein LXA43DRAFT_713507 [Ganoderma leucocontextum]|nr:hypothetical protein LXA43DRAFT_713507 [Ganoderma leucocontextum]